MLTPTVAAAKIAMMRERKKIVQGGTYAGKTYSIMALLINAAIDCPGSRITVVAETIPAVRDGAAQIFKSIMDDERLENWDEKRWRSMPMDYRFVGGSVIQFRSFETEGKARDAGKRDYLFLNEANEIPFDIAHALISRSEKDIYIDFNPTHEFWVHRELVGQPDTSFLKLTYRDNRPQKAGMEPTMPASILKELQLAREKAKTSDYWANWCRVYLDGEVGQIQGTVFDNWAVVDRIPDDAQLLGYGLDFGFTNHPTALVAGYKYNGRMIWDEVVYQRGLMNMDLVKIMDHKLVKKNVPIYADNSEPRNREEIIAISGKERPPAYRVFPCDKRGGINFGISILQQEEFSVTASSKNLINELRRYSWDKSRDGQTMNRPIDAFNHCIDAMRYLAVEKMTSRRRGVATIGRTYLI